LQMSYNIGKTLTEPKGSKFMSLKTIEHAIRLELVPSDD